MFCTGCGNQLPEGTEICPICGAYFNVKLEMGLQESTVANNATASQGGYRNTGNGTQMGYQNLNNGNYTQSGNQVPKYGSYAQIGNQTANGASGVSNGMQSGTGHQIQNYKQQQQEERSIKNVEELFIDNDEEQIAVLGGGYLANMLHGGGLSKGFGILTDKRYYFKGKCYSKQGRRFVKTDEEWTVDVKDITASGFIYNRVISLLVIAIVCILAGFFILAACEGDDDAIPFLIIGIIAGLIFLIAYALSKRGMYVVMFAGGSVALRTSKYGGTKEVKKFDKKLRQTKDKVLGGE